MWRSGTLAVAVAVVVGTVAACGGNGSKASSAPASAGASASAGAATPAPATATPAAPGDWATYNGDAARTGLAPAGPPLGQVRSAWSTSVGGSIYAQPLVVGDTVIVAGENDAVTALRASDGGRIWRRSVGRPVSGGSLPCGNIDPSGITGTPVADPSRGLLYVVGFLRGPRHALFAIELRTGKIRWTRPVDAPGADPSVHQQRGALALSHGRVYIPYGGLYGDCGNYHGRVVSVPASGPSGRLAGYRVPAAREAGIWAPPGPSVDSRGNLYVATGNGSSTRSFDYGNAVIRLSPNLRARGYFAPRGAPHLNASDTDLGSTSPVLLGGGRAFVIGKSGIGYLLDTGHLGGIGHPLSSRSVCGAAFGGTAFAGGTLYVPCTDGIVAVRAAAGLREVWTQRTVDRSPIVAGPGVWGIGGSRLYQLDPGSGKVRFSAAIGSTTHFTAPAAAGGRVFVAAGGRVHAFAAR